MKDQQHIHANTASVAKLSPQVARSMANFAGSLANDDFYLSSYAVVNNIRDQVYQNIADLLACDPANLSLHSSTSAALAKAVMSLPASRRKHIAFSAACYASAKALAEVLVQHGSSVTYVGRNTGYVGIDDLDAMTDLPDVLVLEWVNHRSGCVSPLDLISRWCRENDVLLVVDAVQALGAVPLVFDTERIDFMAGAAHKWLGGPEGIGFLYSAPEHVHALNPILPGYASLKTAGQMDHLPMFHDNGRRLETGTLSSISLVGFASAMAELQEFGYHQRLLKIGYLHQRIIEVLRQYPAVQLMDDPRSDGPSGIISFVVSDINTDALVRQLAVCGVTAKNRDGVVRLSPSHDIDGDALTARLTLALDHVFASERAAYV